MSLGQRVYPRNPIYKMFTQRLVEEIKSPQPGTAEPIIILFEIVLEAYREAKGTGFASQLRVALGLTQEEARRMGIDYVPLETAS